jgi:hypothetical protein
MKNPEKVATVFVREESYRAWCGRWSGSDHTDRRATTNSPRAMIGDTTPLTFGEPAMSLWQLPQEVASWVAYFCTDPAASVADILAAVAGRFSLEQAFKDLKEVWGIGQQQLRNVHANIGAYHLSVWLHTLVEVWAWDRGGGRLANHSASPWDDPERRPSRADRRRALQRECLRAEYQAATRGRGRERNILRLARRLLRMVE